MTLVQLKKAREELSRPMYRFLNNYERRNGYSRGEKKLRVDSVTLVFYDSIVTLTKDN